MPIRKRFKTILEPVKGTQAATTTIPFDVEKAFGSRARIPVRGTINGFAFRSSIFPRGGGVFYMVINKTMREGAGVKTGDKVEIELERDDTPRVVKAPPDLMRALKATPSAMARWDKLSYTHRKEWVKYIEYARRPETRVRRITKAVEDVARGEVEP